MEKLEFNKNLIIPHEKNSVSERISMEVDSIPACSPPSTIRDTSKECPTCGYENENHFNFLPKPIERKPFDGTTLKFFIGTAECSICEDDVYEEDIDKAYIKARSESKKERVNYYLDKLEGYFGTLSTVERLFEIPQNTLKQLKNKEPCSVTYAFLAMLVQVNKNTTTKDLCDGD